MSSCISLPTALETLSSLDSDVRNAAAAAGNGFGGGDLLCGCLGGVLFEAVGAGAGA